MFYSLEFKYSVLSLGVEEHDSVVGAGKVKLFDIFDILDEVAINDKRREHTKGLEHILEHPA